MKWLSDAIRSQANLKAHYYSRAKKVGAVGCVFGLLIAYQFWILLFGALGIQLDVPIFEYAADKLTIAFVCMFFTLMLFTYLGCIFVASIYYGMAYKKGLISKQELFSILVKGLYPDAWQKVA